MAKQPVYTVEEVAEILRVHPRTIYRALVAGTLPGFKIGDSWRVTEEQLASYMRGGNPVEK